jgi:hypothetical protein
MGEGRISFHRRSIGTTYNCRSIRVCSKLLTFEIKRYGAKMLNLVTPFGSTDAVHCSCGQPKRSPRLHVRCDVYDETISSCLLPAGRSQSAKLPVLGDACHCGTGSVLEIVLLIREPRTAS